VRRGYDPAVATQPSNKVRDGEEIVLDLRPHWWYFVRETALLVGALVVGIVALALDWHESVKVLAALVILGSLLWAAVSYVRWASTHLVLTTDRLIYRSGVLTRTGIEIPLERINTVFFRQTLLERAIQSGDLVVESAGEMGRQNFSNMRRPLNVQNEIYKQMEDNENRKYDRVGRSGGSGPGPGHSIPDQIAQLDELRQRGVLTDDEFQQKKADLLRRM
jgi:membrane protein YdbS with pleckstrin-like domain